MPRRKTTTTNETTDLGTLLFKHRKLNLRLAPGYSLGDTYAEDDALISSKSTRKHKPKFSIIPYLMENIMDYRVSAITFPDLHIVYTEKAVSDPTGDFVISEMFNAETGVFSVSSTARNIDTLLPMFIACVGDYSSCIITRQSVTDYMELTKSCPATTIIKELAYICDCFYYDAKAAYPNDEFTIQPITQSDYEMLNLAIARNEAQPVGGPLKIDGTDFQYIKYGESASTFAVSTTDNSISAIFDKAKAEEFVIGFDWNDEQMQQIQPISMLDDYIPNNTYKKMLTLINKKLNRVLGRIADGASYADSIKDDYINIIIGSRPGTGKTTTVNALSASLGLPIYTVKVTKNTEEDTFEGMTKVNSEGKFAIHDTAFLKAFEHGGIVLMEEFNLADPGVLQGAIGQAIERPFILNKDGYQEVKRHPLCIVVATMNTGTQGAREPNQALTSRLPVTLTMDDPSDDDFLSILEKHGYEKSQCKKVYKAYTSILNYLKNTALSEEMSLCVTMRHCLAALSLLDDEVTSSVSEAVYDTMIGSIGLRDAQLAKEVYENAVQPLPL
jgi:hypothetical protein